MQQKQHAMFIAMVIGLCVAASFVVQAEDVLRVSVPHLPPYADLCQDKSAKGLLPDLFTEIAKKMGVSLQLRVVPLPRVIIELQDGDSDATILVQNTNVEAVMERVIETPLRALQSVIVGKASMPLQSYQDLEGKVLGIPRGVTGAPEFMDNARIEKYAFTNYQQAAKMLQMDRLNAVDGTHLALYAALKAEGFTPADLGDPLIIQGHPAYVYFSKNAAQPALFESLKAACAELIKNGTFARIEQGYWDCFIEQKSCETLNY